MPKYLMEFRLSLQENNLGSNADNLKYLVRKFPDNLKSLRLDLKYNRLGKKEGVLKYFGEFMK